MKSKFYDKKYVYYLLSFLLGFLLFIIVGLQLKKNTFYLDILINQKVILIQNRFLSNFLLLITNIAHPIVLSLLSLIVFIYLIYKKRQNHSLLFGSAMLGGLLIETIIKNIIKRQRPFDRLIEAHTYSFPSGHSTMSIIFFLFLIYLFKDDITNKVVKGLFISISILLFLLIGFSRIYFDVHWFSDVIAGFLLGLFWTYILVAFFQKFLDSHNSDSKLR